MRLIHRIPFSKQEVESYRQLVFNNLTHGLKYLLDAMEDMGLEVTSENVEHIEKVENAVDLRDGEPFPESYLDPLKLLWADVSVQKAWERGNEAALPEKCAFRCNQCQLMTFTDCSSFQSFVFLLRLRSTVCSGLCSHGTGHCSMPGSDDRYH